MRSILISHVKVIKNPQNVHEICFWPILMTFTCDMIINIIIGEPSLPFLTSQRARQDMLLPKTNCNPGLKAFKWNAIF